MKEIVFIDVAAEMGGVEYSTLYLVTRLDPAQWHPLVICPIEGTLPRLCRQAGIPVQIIPRPQMVSTSIRLGRRFLFNPFAIVWNILMFLVAALRLWRVLRSLKPDLVCTKGLHAHFYGGLAAWLGHISCVWHLQDEIEKVRGHGLFPLLQSTGARLFAREIIADGAVIAGQVDARFYPPACVHVIYNGVDTTEFSPEVDGSAARAEFYTPDKGLVVGCVGRLVSTKGQHIFVQAVARIAAQFPTARFWIVGATLFNYEYYAQELRDMVVQLGLQEQIVFTGYRTDLAKVLAAMDLFVFPSISKDTSPLVLVSALASGKATIAARTPGIVEMFQGQDSVLWVPADDPYSLADAMRAVLGDPVLRRRLGQVARTKALTDLSIEQFTRKCEHIFAQASNSR